MDILSFIENRVLVDTSDESHLEQAYTIMHSPINAALGDFIFNLIIKTATAAIASGGEKNLIQVKAKIEAYEELLELINEKSEQYEKEKRG